MDPSLIRAARALLNWHQRDLAKASGLSLTAIKNFEHGSNATRSATILAMKTALEAQGVEFPPSGGVRRSDDITGITRYSGNSFIHSHNETVYAAVRQPGSEILTCSVDDSMWHSRAIIDDNRQFHIWCKRLNIAEKILVPEGNTFFNTAKQQYRALPPEMIGKITYVIYADRISFIFWKKKQSFILRNSLIVETFRQQFKYLWRLGKTV